MSVISGCIPEWKIWISIKDDECKRWLRSLFTQYEGITEEERGTFYWNSEFSSIKRSSDVHSKAAKRIDLINSIIYFKHRSSDCLKVDAVGSKEDSFRSRTVFASASVIGRAICSANGAKILTSGEESIEEPQRSLLSLCDSNKNIEDVISELNASCDTYINLRRAVEIMFSDDDNLKKKHHKSKEHDNWCICIHQEEYSGSKAIHLRSNKRVAEKPLSEAEIVSYPRRLFTEWIIDKS